MGKVDFQSRPFVLLTGATGLVGGLVVAQLLKSDLPVAVLVRANRRQSAHDRVDGLMRRLEERFGRHFTRPVVLSADLCTPGLELSESDRGWIADNCGTVIHSAANLLFRPAHQHPDNEPYRTNVHGTMHLLQVTQSAGIDEWHYVSTAYIAGQRTGRVLEQETDVGQQFGNDYERSKTLCEQMLRQSNSVRSLTVYRPSIVIDLHPTTSMRSDQTINSAFAMFQGLSQRFGLPERGDWFRRLGFSGHERKNIVTVDWVTRMIAQIYRRPSLHGQTYHLTSPAGTSASELEDGFRDAVIKSGMRLPPSRAEVTSQIDEQAAPFVAAFSPYFKDDPIFDRSNTVRAMAECSESDLPDLTPDDLRDFCMRQTKPPASPVIVKSKPSAWSAFLNRAPNCVPPELSQILSRNPMGLELYGAGGGQWLIDDFPETPMAFPASAALPGTRIISTTQTFCQLIDGELSVATAVEGGMLLLESDKAGTACSPNFPNESTNTLPDRLKRLIAAVQQHYQQRGLRSEVANVG